MKFCVIHLREISQKCPRYQPLIWVSISLIHHYIHICHGANELSHRCVAPSVIISVAVFAHKCPFAKIFQGHPQARHELFTTGDKIYIQILLVKNLYLNFLLLLMIMRSHHLSDQWDLKTPRCFEKENDIRCRKDTLCGWQVFIAGVICYITYQYAGILLAFSVLFKAESTENLVSNIKEC